MSLDKAVSNLEKTVKGHLLDEVHDVLVTANAPVSAMILAILAVDCVSQYYCGREKAKRHGHKVFDPQLCRCISEFSEKYLNSYQRILPKIRNSLVHSYALPVGVLIVDKRSEHDMELGKIYVKKFVKDISNAINDYFSDLKHDNHLMNKFYRHYKSIHLVPYSCINNVDPEEAIKSIYFI